MMITTKGRNALKIMIELARCEGEGFISLNDVAERQKVSGSFCGAAFCGGLCRKRSRQKRRI